MNRPERLVAGIDSSTQSCTAVVVDLDSGRVVRSGSARHPVGTELDPESWWHALQQALRAAGGLQDVSAISIAAQQHGLVGLDGRGRVIRPALLWHDMRSVPEAVQLTRELGAAMLARRTGLVPVSSFTIAKLRWLRDHEPDHAAQLAAVALPHDWLTWRLLGSGRIEDLVTDASEASGTGYFSPHTARYDLAVFTHALGREGREAGQGTGDGRGEERAVLLPRILSSARAWATTRPRPSVWTSDPVR
jgi:xylulokinase